jgi:hypothetical protein
VLVKCKDVGLSEELYLGLAFGKTVFLASYNGEGNKRFAMNIPERPRTRVTHITTRKNINAACARLIAINIATKKAPPTLPLGMAGHKLMHCGSGGKPTVFPAEIHWGKCSHRKPDIYSNMLRPLMCLKVGRMTRPFAFHKIVSTPCSNGTPVRPL